MKIFTLKKNQILQISLEESWKFFSNPLNLETITPPDLGLEITSEKNNSIYEGMIITYFVSPLPGIKINWVTEITHVKEPNYFVDEQRIGPYKFWHHKHFFREIDGGVEVEDLVHYALPLGPLGEVINKLYVRKSLDKIFNYRSNVLKKQFSEINDRK